MEINLEKECGALGGLFQQIINDMKTSAPVWEDFINKAGKLHTTLRATILATSAFLEAFQKVADMATNTRGATREIGSALTRLCMRHRSIENKLKHFTSALLETLVNPLQERTEEWKRSVVQLDKDHAKDYKKARQEIKKASSDTIRLQKKVKKGKSDMQHRLDNALHDVNDKFHLLEETEKNAVRTALIEERSRFCLFISCLKPVVDQEISMLAEVTHLQEITQNLCLQAGDPYTLPPASEQVIQDLKGKDHSQWSFHTPPSSPSSLGSRKSSMCSISSINSSSSGSSKSHSPSHHYRHRAPSQPPPSTARLSSISSQDSGFTSQDTLFLKPPSPSSRRKSSLHEGSSGSNDSEATTPTSPSHLAGSANSASTWTNWPEPPSTPGGKGEIAKAGPEGGGSATDRPHTISTAYERTQKRPALTAQTFDPPDHPCLLEQKSTGAAASPYAVPCIVPPSKSKPPTQLQQQQQQQIYASLNKTKLADTPPHPGPKMRARHVALPTVPDFNNAQSDQIYVNMNELATMAAQKHHEYEKMLEKKAREQLVRGSSMEQPENASDQQGQKSRPQRSSSVPAQYDYDTSSLRRVIEELNTSTAALRSLPATESVAKREMVGQEAPNSLELAQAIKELEASTAALQMSYDDDSNPRNSIQCSSGYGTMSSTPACSEDTIASGELFEFYSGENLAIKSKDVVHPDLQCDPDLELDYKYSTLPLRREGNRLYKSFSAFKRPASTAGVPASPNSSTATIRRGSFQGAKPVTPIRRNSSISGALPVMTPTVPSSAFDSDHHDNHCDVDGDITPRSEAPPTQMQDSLQVSTNSDSSLSDEQLTPKVESIVQSFEAQSVELPPPPPLLTPPKHSGSVSSTDTLNDSSEDLPLPPPPDELLMPPDMVNGDNGEDYEDHFSCEKRGSVVEASEARCRGSVVESHATIISTLNQKFAGGLTPLGKPPPSPRLSQSSASSDSISSDDITPTGDTPPDSLMSQIRRGVVLRKTVSNDRSNPKFNY